MLWAIALSALSGYAIGSIEFSLIIGRLTRGVDIRDYGSGNAGAANVIRTAGAKAGVLVILLDMAKGIVPVYLGLALGNAAGLDHDEGAWVAATGAFAAVCGHVWPIWFGFRGGKAVATGFGAALAMNPLATLAMIPIAGVILLTTRIMSFMNILMAPLLALFFVILAALEISPWAYAAYGLATSALIVYRHRANIERLRAGTEPRLGQAGEKRATASG